MGRTPVMALRIYRRPLALHVVTAAHLDRMRWGIRTLQLVIVRRPLKAAPAIVSTSQGFGRPLQYILQRSDRIVFRHHERADHYIPRQLWDSVRSLVSDRITKLLELRGQRPSFRFATKHDRKVDLPWLRKIIATRLHLSQDVAILVVGEYELHETPNVIIEKHGEPS